MRANREIIAITVLVVVFIIAGLLLGGGDRGRDMQVGSEQSPDPSVMNDRGSGAKGFFAWSGRLGYRPEAWRHPWKDLRNEKASILFVIDPGFPKENTAFGGFFGSSDSAADTDQTVLHGSDAIHLMDWVRGGHTAVLMASEIAKTKDKTKEGFGEVADILTEENPSGAASPEDYSRKDFVPKQPMRDTHGVLSVHRAGRRESVADLMSGISPKSWGNPDTPTRLARKTPDAVALFGDSAGPFVLSVAAGRGRLIVIADSYFASNANLPRADNALFLANVLRDHARPGERILFDELHHGDASELESPTLWKALGAPLQLALIQLFCAFLVLVGVVAVRFGTPVPLMQGVTRTSAEYVGSLAGLYRRARASTTALETLYRQFLRDLCGRLGIASTSSLEEVAVIAARRFHTDPDRLRRLFATCEQRLDQGKISELELLELTRLMETIRKDIGIV